MTNMKTLAEIMNGHAYAEILCPVRNIVVRRLVVCDGTLEIDASGPWGREEYAAPIDTETKLRPCFMDRGDIMVTTGDGLVIKLCTEGDTIRYEDGTTGWMVV